MPIKILGAREHNLKNCELEIGGGLTVVTGVSGSGKTSLVFDTLYYEARRRFLEVYALGSNAVHQSPANVDAITGLGPAVAVGQNLLNRNPSSTLATASGLHPFLRLLFARFGARSCPRCAEPFTISTEDEVVERLATLAANQAVQLFAPLVSQVPGSHSLLLAELVEWFGEEALWVDGKPWNGHPLSPTRPHNLSIRLVDLPPNSYLADIRPWVQKAIALGTHAVQVHWPGGQETLAFAPVCLVCGAWLGELHPADFHSTCAHCSGTGCPECRQTGLPPQVAAVTWDGVGFLEYLHQDVDEALAHLKTCSAPITARLRLEIERRLQALQRVGLGYIALNRSSPSLSRGEAQRVRLALTLISRLEDMLHVLDEPTVGQHPWDVERLLPAFRELAGPVVFVEHDRVAAAHADQAVDLGPGAGHRGGRVIFSGTPAELWQADTPTGRYFSRRIHQPASTPRPAPDSFITIQGASLRNLQIEQVAVPLGRLTVVTGVSGSGKSTLVEDVLVASLTSGQPNGCRAVIGKSIKPVMVDQSPIGRNPRSNPATYTKLADLVRDLFSEITGLSPSHFTFNRPEGACPTCDGLGAVEVPMRYLPSTWIPCADCDGQRFREEVLAARLSFDGRMLSIADYFELSVDEALAFWLAESRLPEAKKQAAVRILSALQEIGLGYLTLGQPSPTLSGGEAQRVKLARYLGLKALTKEFLVLDEPTTGLHPQDLAGLLTVFNRLVSAGATLLVVEHNLDVVRAADWVIDLGPGAGPQGGRLLYAGPPLGLLSAAGSCTAEALLSEENLSPVLLPAATSHTKKSPGCISIRGARVHNLQNVSVDIPKGKLTVITGVSGSGKSSLAGDVLEVEARRRFLETLSMYERQGTHEGPEAEVDAITGLGVALTIGSERLVYSRRATVGSATDITHHLAILLAEVGERACLQCGAAMRRDIQEWHCPACQTRAPFARPRHFLSSTYAAACLKCNGVGTLQSPQPNKLIIHPEKPLTNGAMYSPGFFPDGYLGKPLNGGYYQVQALGQRYGFDPEHTPWNAMSPEAQHAFLFGDPQPMTVTYHSRTGRTYTHASKFPGFYGFIRDWDVGGTYTDTVACPVCGGARLRPEYLAVQFQGYNIYQMSQMTLRELAQLLEKTPGDLFTQPWLREPRSVQNSYQTVLQRLQFLRRVGLDYLNLERPAGTLSAGEAQRIRLASLLSSGLTSLTLLLDEPTRGLHPREIQALVDALATLRDQGNTVIVVEHDLLVMKGADYLIDMGPGAGRAGGQVVAQGTPAQVAQAPTLTGAWLRNERRIEPPARLPPQDWMTVVGARANNLQDEAVRFPLGRLVGVCGVSGSGKSTLVMDTLGRALAPKKHTTSVSFEPLEPGEYDRIENAPRRVVVVDQSRAGLGSPASFFDLPRLLQKVYLASPEAQTLGIGEEQLTARCSVCGGRGVIHLDMAFLPGVNQPCLACLGTGYLPEAWQVRLHGVALPEVYGMTIDQVLDLFGEDPALAPPLRVARQVGLGYLVLRQPGYALSGGEAQRLKIAQELYRKAPTGTLYLLDEPSVGQHLEDVNRLAGVLRTLVAASGSVIMVEHHPHLLAACDWLIELGPGGGPDGGRLVAQGTPEELASGATPISSYLREVIL